MPRKQHKITVTPHRRSKPDMHKLARALLLLAAADAEKEAQAQAQHLGEPTRSRQPTKGSS